MTMAETAAPAGDDPLAHAEAIAACGLRVLPIKPGAKYPPMNSWQHAASADPTVARKWWNGLYRGHGVGIAMGPQPDGRWLFAVDIDEHDPACSGSDTLAALESVHGRLPDTVRSITGSGGAHLIYDSAGVPITNGRAGQLGPGIDVRGDGGQIVVAPTIHPNGHPYIWEAGYAPWEHPIAIASAWLLDLAAPPTPEPPRAAPPTAPSGDSPADIIRHGWDWPQELARRGWTLHHTTGTDSHWTRPGKHPREGTSGVLHGADGPFVVFTTDATAAPMWRAGKVSRDGSCVSLSPLAYTAAYDHAGDLTAASRAIRAAMPASDLRGLVAAPSTLPDAAVETIDEPIDDWQPIPLADIATAIRNGTHEPTQPTVLAVFGAAPLFYPARVNSLFGESGGGKTWVALAATAEQLNAGQRVLMIDYEDNAAGIAERLVQLGLNLDAIALLDYRNPSTALAFGLQALTDTLDEYALIVIDSTGEAMASGGTNPNADEEVARWFTIARRLCRLPGSPAVVVLDHVPKDRDAPASYAIGSQRKRAAVTGASYRVDTIKEFAKGRDGKMKLTVAKDRPGNRAKGATAAIVEVHSGDNGAVAMAITAPPHGHSEDGEERFRPTTLMERVSRWLELHMGASVREIVAGVSGKQAFIKDALRVLVDEQWVVEEPGERGAKKHRVTRPYRESDDQKAVDNSPAALIGPTASHRVRPRPDRVRDAVPTSETTASPVPLPYGGRDAVDGRQTEISTGNDRDAVNNPTDLLRLLDGTTPPETKP